MKLKYLAIGMVAVLISMSLMSCASDKINEAQGLYDEGNYTEALNILEEIKNNKDASALASECQACLDYEEAQQLFDSGNYSDALAKLENVTDNADADALAAECKNYLDNM